MSLVKKVEQLELPNGKEPFSEWFDDLDIRIQAKVALFVDRVAAGGSKKNIKPLGEGVFEIKIDFGSGYRVYFGELDNIIILLLLGGDKSTQSKDIETAKRYWREYVQK